MSVDTKIEILTGVLARIRRASPNLQYKVVLPPGGPDDEFSEMERALARARQNETLMQVYITLLEDVAACARGCLPTGDALAALAKWTGANPRLYFVTYL
jgi:hypothetical protein